MVTTDILSLQSLSRKLVKCTDALSQLCESDLLMLLPPVSILLLIYCSSLSFYTRILLGFGICI